MTCKEALGQLRSLEKNSGVRLSLRGGDICIKALDKTKHGFLQKVKVMPRGQTASQTISLVGILFTCSPSPFSSLSAPALHSANMIIYNV